MRHTRGSLITTAEALQQVFNVSVKSPLHPSNCSRLGKITCLHPKPFSTSSVHQATYRPLAADSGRPSLQSRPSFQPRDVDVSRYGPKVDRPPRDEEIRAWRAHVKLPNGRLSEPQSLADILDGRAHDEKDKYSQFVQELAPADPKTGREYSILAYFDKKQVKEQELAQKKKSKHVATKEKSLELSWSIDGHDLQHRLDRMKAFLEKGNKVEVVFGSTRIRGWGLKRKITEDEGQVLLDKFRQMALEVEGTKVLKELNGRLLGQASICFQGPSKKDKDVDRGIEEVVEDA